MTSTRGQNDVTWGQAIDIESLQNRLLKVCYVHVTSAGLPRLLFFAPAIQSTNEANKAGGTVKQSILLRCLWGKLTELVCHPTIE
jgi:hypothetical protein